MAGHNHNYGRLGLYGGVRNKELSFAKGHGSRAIWAGVHQSKIRFKPTLLSGLVNQGFRKNLLMMTMFDHMRCCSNRSEQ